jgi:hypothetical protein
MAPTANPQIRAITGIGKGCGVGRTYTIMKEIVAIQNDVIQACAIIDGVVYLTISR